jgi:threonine/homoserine/homoserine lactone efflux protein
VSSRLTVRDNLRVSKSADRGRLKVLRSVPALLFLFLKGVFLGLALTAPVGPINLLCMRRTLAHGLKIGLLTGFGAATADTFFGAVAAFSLTWISDFLKTYQSSLQVIGGIVFIFIGISLIRSHPSTVSDTSNKELSPFQVYFSSLVLTLSNPTTVFAFLVAFAALNLGHQISNSLGASVATLGVFCGAMLWWSILSWGSSMLRERLNELTVHRINVATGVLLLAFAGVLIVHGVRAHFT